MEAHLPDSVRSQSVAVFFVSNSQQFLPILNLLIDAKRQRYDFTHAVGVGR